MPRHVEHCLRRDCILQLAADCCSRKRHRSYAPAGQLERVHQPTARGLRRPETAVSGCALCTACALCTVCRTFCPGRKPLKLLGALRTRIDQVAMEKLSPLNWPGQARTVAFLPPVVLTSAGIIHPRSRMSCTTCAPAGCEILPGPEIVVYGC